MKLIRSSGALLVALTLALVGGAASAAIIDSGSAPFTEPQFALYSGTKSYTVYTHDDANNPAPGNPGEFTYVYTISNDPGSTISIIGFELSVPIDSVVSSGFVDDANAATPPAASVTDLNDGVVKWDWVDASGLIAPGQTSDPVWVISTFLPGNLADTMVGYDGQLAFDTDGNCVGPFVEPAQECDLQVEKEACVVQPPDPGGDSCQGKATKLHFQYTGLGCDATSHLQAPHKVRCRGGADGDEPVDIIVYSKHKRWWGRHWRKKIFAIEHGVNVGDEIWVDAANANKPHLPRSLRYKIRSGYNTIEKGKFHTSCSEPLEPGDNFGSLLLTQLTSTQGGTVTLSEEDEMEECISEINVTPAPHCVGSIKKLVLRYVGGDCTNTVHSQGSSAYCVDINPPTTDPVRIIVSDSQSPSSNILLDQEPIEVGDFITIDPAVIGASTLDDFTGFWIKDALTNDLLQDGYFKTNCWKPLDLGDQIGGLQVFTIETTGGGTASLGADVKYTYTVTNPNTGDATNVTVDDDLLGNIATGETVAGGASEMYMVTEFIYEDTTNVVTVNGTVDGVQCNEATDSATVTVEEPDDGSVCTTMVQAMLLKYTGPNIWDADVTFQDAHGNSVTYYNVDLIGGVTTLQKPSQGGYTFNAASFGEVDFGSGVWISIHNCGSPSMEDIDTTCSGVDNFEINQPAPLLGGGTSSNWKVIDFKQKD